MVKKIKLADTNAKKGADFDFPLISTVEGEDLNLKAVRFNDSQYGEYAVITTTKHGKLRSSNQVVLSQLHKLHEHLQAGAIVQCTVKREKDYFFLA